jgi:hypothetical protein
MDRLVGLELPCTTGAYANQSSDDGFNKPTLIPYQPNATVQVPSNVTRISRALTKVGDDGVHQIIFYHSGVGTSQGILDSFTGGALGKGISEVGSSYSSKKQQLNITEHP